MLDAMARLYTYTINQYTYINVGSCVRGCESALPHRPQLLLSQVTLPARSNSTETEGGGESDALKVSDAAMMCAWVRVGVATFRTPFVVAGGSSGKLELNGD